MLRTAIALSLLILALPQPPQGQSRTAADRIAAIEGAQPSEGANGLGKLTIDELMKRFTGRPADAGEKDPVSLVRNLAPLVATFALAGQAEATELLIRVARPAGYTQPAQLKKAELLLAWWGATEAVPLAHRYDAGELVVTVPLDREVWTSLGAVQAPDFAYVYFEFNDFVPVQSERFYWLGGNAPAPAPVNWESVLRIDLPANAKVGGISYCYLPGGR